MSLTRLAEQDKKFKTEKIITSTWSDNTNNLSSVYTSSLNDINSPTSSGMFYINVYHKPTTGHASPDDDAEVQCALAYGNKNGSGSRDFTNDTGSFGKNAARCIYGQYRNLIYGDETQNFTFGSHTPEDIYVINVNRGRYKNALNMSSLSLYLSSSTSTYKLTDDSVSANGAAVQTNLGRQFNIVSGASGVYSGSTVNQVGGSASFGLYYPDAGIIILNPDAFASSSDGTSLYPGRHSAFNTNTDNNTQRFYNALSHSGHFIVDSEETITSRYYFVRARNYEYNYTTNPSFQDASGNVNFTSMINNPKTFITTVGLYNDKNELLAVAKTSQPISKDSTKEALIRVKLDY